MKCKLLCAFLLGALMLRAEDATVTPPPAETNTPSVTLENADARTKLMVERIKLQGEAMNLQQQIQNAPLDPKNTSEEIEALRKEIDALQNEVNQKRGEVIKKVRELPTIKALQTKDKEIQERVKTITAELDKLPAER